MSLANLTHPNPSILGPGALALALWLVIPLTWPGASQALGFTVAFCGSYLALVGRRCYGLFRGGRAAFQSWTAVWPVAGIVVVLIGVLLWKQDIIWCQRVISVQMGILSVTHLLRLRLADDADTEWLWGPLRRPERHRLFSAGTVLLSLMTVLLNETMIRFTSPADWMVAWAISPVVLHYANVFMIHIAVLSDESLSQ